MANAAPVAEAIENIFQVKIEAIAIKASNPNHASGAGAPFTDSPASTLKPKYGVPLQPSQPKVA